MATDLMERLRQAAKKATRRRGPPCSICAKPEIRARIVKLHGEGLLFTAIVVAVKEIEGVEFRAERLRYCLREHGR